jgi:hypothetical protein
MAERAPMHPALRWVSPDDGPEAHRRGPDGWTTCGAPGPLTLAPGGADMCAACYPPQDPR